jgi:hypothetical protein
MTRFKLFKEKRVVILGVLAFLLTLLHVYIIHDYLIPLLVDRHNAYS